MALEPVICPHCQFKFKTDVEAQINEGDTTAVRGLLTSKPETRSVSTIDLCCPKCNRKFELKYER